MLSSDMPLWARGAAVPLLVLGSWWVRETEALRNVAGETVGLAALSVMAVFILRGMNLQLGLWPTGPLRPELDLKVVALVALSFALLVLAPQPGTNPVLTGLVDPAGLALASVGVGAMAVSTGLVEQGPSARWYALAAGAALVPVMVPVAANVGSGELCLVSSNPRSGCQVGLIRALAFGTAVAVPIAFASLELTFRRMLLGRTAGAGVIVVLGGALAASIWWVLAWGGDWNVELWLWVLGAVAAGGLYALSGSLLVSALYSGLLLGSQLAAAAAGVGAVGPGEGTVGWVAVAAHLAVAAGLVVWVFRENGLLGRAKLPGRLREVESDEIGPEEDEATMLEHMVKEDRLRRQSGDASGR